MAALAAAVSAAAAPAVPAVGGHHGAGVGAVAAGGLARHGLSGGPRPCSVEEVRALIAGGVGAVISLEHVCDEALAALEAIDHKAYDVVDYWPLTKWQADAAYAFYQRQRALGRRVHVHCFAGNGRTGMLLVCIVGRELGVSGDEAIQLVRAERPLTMRNNNAAQVAFVRAYLLQYQVPQPAAGVLAAASDLTGLLAGHGLSAGAMPSADDVADLVAGGVGAMISLQRIVAPGAAAAANAIAHKEVLVPDFMSPTPAQVDTAFAWYQMQRWCLPGRIVHVHCTAGLGRSGTLLACIVGRLGDLTGPEAIRQVRAARPGSIETVAQETFVTAYLAAAAAAVTAAATAAASAAGAAGGGGDAAGSAGVGAVGACAAASGAGNC